MDKTEYINHVNILKNELVCALGCTEPIAIAYAASLARRAMGATPDHIKVLCSGNMIKNVKSVTVPNSNGMIGIEAAATLGVVGGNEDKALEVLESITQEDIKLTQKLLDNNFCSVEFVEGVPNLYVSVEAQKDDDTSVATIEERHTNITVLTKNGVSVDFSSSDDDSSCSCVKDTKLECDRDALTLESIWNFIHDVDVEDIRCCVENQIKCNSAIADEGIKNDWGANVGSTLLSTRPDDIIVRAKARAAAGSDARMNGCPMPVVIVCGSGNQGMTASLPVIEYAKHLNKSQDELIRAIALSDLVAVHIKHYIGELSAFCGAVSAACGVGSAVCYLKGGNLDQVGNTIQNTLGNVSGIVCDGAKSSCAAKIASSVDAALLGCDMALANQAFKPQEGLLGNSFEETIKNVGYVGRVGMCSTDIEILNIMTNKADVEL